MAPHSKLSVKPSTDLYNSLPSIKKSAPFLSSKHDSDIGGHPVFTDSSFNQLVDERHTNLKLTKNQMKTINDMHNRELNKKLSQQLQLRNSISDYSLPNATN